MFVIIKTILLPKLQKQPRSGLRSSPSGSCFDPKVNFCSHVKLTNGDIFLTAHELYLSH